MRASRLLARSLGIFALLALATPCAAAQSLADLREELRESLHGRRFGHGIVALSDLANEQELAAARYEIDDEQDTSVSTLSLPWQTSRELPGSSRSLYLEANFGYMQAEGELDDILEGTLPGMEVGYDSKWTAISGLVGAGIACPLANGLTLTPIVDLSLTHLKNESDYAGPGEAAYAPVFDGILFNWSSTILGVGGALRADLSGDVTGDIRYELVGRYDLRHLETLRSTDSAQDLSEASQFVTGRVEFSGFMPIVIGHENIEWHTHVGYRSFFAETADALGFGDFVELGGGLDFAALGLSKVSLQGSVLEGHDVSGWTLGLSASF